VTPDQTREAASGRRLPRLLKRTVLGIGLAALLIIVSLSGYACYTIQHNNFHTVSPKQVYRSAQMNKVELTRYIEEYGIKSILNLRGENPATSWYQAEIETAAKLNILHYDRSLASAQELSVEQMDELVSLLRLTPKPMLIHCQGGADRSGLVSALYRLAIEGNEPTAADRELSIWYGHVPLIRPKVKAMDHSFWRYVSNRISRAELNLQPSPAIP